MWITCDIVDPFITKKCVNVVKVLPVLFSTLFELSKAGITSGSYELILQNGDRRGSGAERAAPRHHC